MYITEMKAQTFFKLRKPQTGKTCLFLSKNSPHLSGSERRLGHVPFCVVSSVLGTRYRSKSQIHNQSQTACGNEIMIFWLFFFFYSKNFVLIWGRRKPVAKTDGICYALILTCVRAYFTGPQSSSSLRHMGDVITSSGTQYKSKQPRSHPVKALNYLQRMLPDPL